MGGSSGSPRRPAWASPASWLSSSATSGGAATPSPSASARPTGRRRPTSSGARSGVACSGWRTTTPRATGRGPRAAARGHRSRPRRPRPAARARSSGCHDPGHGPHPGLRRRSCARPRWRTCSRPCLRARAREAPFVAVLEDCHWIDELSRDLLQVLARAAAASAGPVRPRLPAGGGSRVAGSAIERLPGLRRACARPHGAARRRRARPLQAGAARRPRRPRPPPRSWSSSTARSEGNPFYVEELLNFIVAQGHRRRRPGGHGGRPAAGEPPHARPRAASTRRPRGRAGRSRSPASSGRVFQAPILPGAYEELGSARRRAWATWTSCGPSTSSPWIARPTRHGCSSTSSPRRSPTRASPSRCGRCSTGASASTSSATEADDLEHAIPLLEHHYWRSDDEEKKREYLWKAAEAAQAAYANKAAVAYYERLVPLLTDEECLRARAGPRQGVRADG